MLDLVIRGGTVVAPDTTAVLDVGIKDGRIVAVAGPGALGAGAARVLDAAGKIVVPGGIDPHVHCKWHMPMPDGTVKYTDGPEVVSRAALFGGTTTLIDFAQVLPEDTVEGAIQRRDGDWTGNCHCDYAYHIMVQGDLAPDIPAQLAEAVQAGYPTVKMFTTDITPSRRGRMVDFGDIWEVFKALAKAEGLAVIHAEDNDLVMHMYAKMFREGRTSFHHLSEVHSALSEDLSFRRVLRLAESVPGAALYFMHVSAGTGVRAIREARAKGLPVYGESLHQYMMYTEEDYKRPNGQIYHTYPSLKSPQDQAELWRGTRDGSINCVATDEICCTLALKVRGQQIDDTTGGNAGVEPRMGIMYTEMVGRRGYSLRQYVDLVSTNAARIMGLYPRKGAIMPGADADIAILDPGTPRVVHKEDLHETDYSPWEGHEVLAWPTVTILRGKVVVENGAFHGSPADGRYQKRRVPRDILSSPCL